MLERGHRRATSVTGIRVATLAQLASRRWNGGVDSDWRTTIAEHRARVEQELTAAAGGASLCSISRSAGPVPGVKYLEGRMTVLRELERASRGGVGGIELVAEAHARWSERLGNAQRRGMGADWTAYYAGGVDELAEMSASESDRVGQRDSPPAG